MNLAQSLALALTLYVLGGINSFVLLIAHDEDNADTLVAILWAVLWPAVTLLFLAWFLAGDPRRRAP